MQEWLPVMLGFAIGVGAMQLSRIRWRLAAMVAACIVAGATASAINGELPRSGWLVFVTMDALLVWLGAAAAVVTLVGVPRLRAS